MKSDFFFLRTAILTEKIVSKEINRLKSRSQLRVSQERDGSSILEPSRDSAGIQLEIRNPVRNSNFQNPVRMENDFQQISFINSLRNMLTILGISIFSCSTVLNQFGDQIFRLNLFKVCGSNATGSTEKFRTRRFSTGRFSIGRFRTGKFSTGKNRYSKVFSTRK